MYYLWYKKVQYCQDIIASRLVHGFSVIAIKILNFFSFLVKLNISIQIYMEIQKAKNSMEIMNKKNLRKLLLLDVKGYYKASN